MDLNNVDDKNQDKTKHTKLILNKGKIEKDLEHQNKEHKKIQEEIADYERRLRNLDESKKWFGLKSYLTPLEPKNPNRPEAFRHESINVLGQELAIKELEDTRKNEEHIRKNLRKLKEEAEKNIKDTQDTSNKLQAIKEQIHKLESGSIASPYQLAASIQANLAEPKQIAQSKLPMILKRSEYYDISHGSNISSIASIREQARQEAGQAKDYIRPSSSPKPRQLSPIEKKRSKEVLGR